MLNTTLIRVSIFRLDGHRLVPCTLHSIYVLAWLKESQQVFFDLDVIKGKAIFFFFFFDPRGAANLVDDCYPSVVTPSIHVH